MGELVINNNGVIYNDETTKKFIVEFYDYINNESSLPLNTANALLPVVNYISQLNTLHPTLASGTDECNYPDDYTLIDALVIRKLLSTSSPLKVLEIGATQGVLSFHLAHLLASFNAESSLCSVTDVIGNESDNHWLERVSVLENLPKLSMLVSDYDYLPLEKNHFDVAIINGSLPLEGIDNLVENVRSRIKPEGTIICYVKNNESLVDNFKKQFRDCECYTLYDNTNVLVEADVQMLGDISKWDDEISKFLSEFEDILKGNPSKGLLRNYIQDMDRFIDLAVEHNDTKLKVKLIDKKGILFDMLVRE